MKKRIFTIFLIILIAVTNMMPVCAAPGVDALTDINLNTDSWQEAIDNKFTEFNKGEKEHLGDEAGDSIQSIGSGIIKVVINILSFVPQLLVTALLSLIELIIPTMDLMIFNDKNSIWGYFFRLSYFDSQPVGFASNLVDAVSLVYQIFRYVALIGFIVAIACIAVKMILSSVGKQKAQYKDSLKNWLIGLVLLVVGHWIMIYSIYFSDYLVNLVCNIKDQLAWTGVNYAEADDFASKADATADFTDNLSSIASLGQFDLTSMFARAVGSNASSALASLTLGPAVFAIVTILWAIMAIIGIIIFIAMNLKLVKVYLERVIVVGILIMIFPLVTVFFAFEKGGIKKGSTFETWLRSFIDQVYIQPIHAITLLGVCIALDAISKTPIATMPIIGMIIVLMILNTVFTIENVIKRVFAINGAGLGSPINPVGAAMAGAGIAAGMARHGVKVGKKEYGNAYKNAYDKEYNKLKGMGKSDADARKGADAVARVAGKSAGITAGIRSVPKFAVTGKAGQQNLKAILGTAGVSLPEQFFDNEKLSQKEQRDATKNLKRAAATKNINGKASIKLRTDTRNLEHMMDPTVVSDLRSAFGINNNLLDKVLLQGNGTDSEQLQVRAYLQSLADPSVDIGSLVKHNTTGADVSLPDGRIIHPDEYYDERGEFDYYISSNDDRIKTDLGMVGELSASVKPADAVINARKTYELKHAEEAEVIKSTLGLDDAKIAAVEAGTGIEQDALAYELFIKKCENPAINLGVCGTPGTLNKDIVHNIDMTESERKDNAKVARTTVVSGTSVDGNVVATRRVYEATNPREAREIRMECPLSDEAITAIEDGQSTYTDGSGTHTIGDAEILEYKIMIDCMANGRKRKDYCVSSGGNVSGAMLDGVNMDVSERFNTASDLTTRVADVIGDPTDNKKARNTLASFKTADEGKFARDCMNAGVDVNEVNNFIEGKPISCDAAAILGVLDVLARSR